MKKIHKSKLRKSRFSKLAPLLNLGIIGDGCFVAGGSLRTVIQNEEVADFDLFFTNHYVYPDVSSYEFAYIPIDGVIFPKITEVKETLIRERFKLVFECPEGKLFTYQKDDIKIQLILENCGSPEFMLDSFDINAGCAAFDGEYFFYKKEFLIDIKTKILSINRVTFPVSTMKRIFKYMKKGYQINEACKQFVKNIEGKVFDGDELRVYID